MVDVSRRKSVAQFILLGGGLILVIFLLYVGWVLFQWRSGWLLALGLLLLLVLIGGVAINTFFLVREIRRNEQQDAFINAVTHELKTPVASIRLYLQTLQTRAVDDDKRQEFYGVMLADSDRLLETIEQVLRTGRIGSRGRRPNFMPIELNAVTEECVSRTRAIYHISPDQLTFRSGPPVNIRADMEEVRAALSNLIDNAVKYSGSDVRVSVETAPVNEHAVAVRVRDHGPGIPQTELKQIFKRFHRVPGAGGVRIPGTGLGLYIVRSVAKRHGGRAWAESEGVGRGSTFVLQLPIAR